MRGVRRALWVDAARDCGARGAAVGRVKAQSTGGPWTVRSRAVGLAPTLPIGAGGCAAGRRGCSATAGRLNLQWGRTGVMLRCSVYFGGTHRTGGRWRARTGSNRRPPDSTAAEHWLADQWILGVRRVDGRHRRPPPTSKTRGGLLGSLPGGGHLYFPVGEQCVHLRSPQETPRRCALAGGSVKGVEEDIFRLDPNGDNRQRACQLFRVRACHRPRSPTAVRLAGR